jgi:hypothetical protein
VIAEIANRTVEYAFEEQGLDTAEFLTETTPTRPLTLAEQADRAVSCQRASKVDHQPACKIDQGIPGHFLI